MTLIIFGIGVLIFFISVYGTVIAGGLRLTVEQVGTQPELAAEAGLAAEQANDDVSMRNVSKTEF